MSKSITQLEAIIRKQEELVNNLTLQLITPEPTTFKKVDENLALIHKEDKLRKNLSLLQSAKEEKEEELITIPKWQLVRIEDVLRQANNIHHSQSKETCFDRCICKTWEFACKALGKEYGFEPDKEPRKESWRDFTMTDKLEPCNHTYIISSWLSTRDMVCIKCGNRVAINLKLSK